ncbi:hypothetical protein EWM64_g10158 [Hericium alpestre]|uniref:Cytochrome P450 n=1 Tax=Hericium alpestre TaxID=135208 RepID=A0A4Y9ZHF2_9AGAM|nr:hypothetical protein EWM64_g10158 [Hericium alpestre]
MGFDWLFSSMLYGPTWRKHRSLFQRHFHQRSTLQHQPVQTIEAHTLLRNLCSTPDDLFHHIRRGSAAVVMDISYGHQVSQEGDIYVTIADRAMTGIAAAGIFGTYLVDYIPWLKYVPSWLPGTGFKRQAKEWRKYSRAMLDRPFEMVQERMRNGTAKPCFATAELENWNKSGQDPAHKIMIQNVAAISYAAGADTTVSALLSFFLAMSLHPEIQVRAQQEIDAVTGGQRLPQFSDRSAFPYIGCIVWECLRWNPVTPLGLIHTATEDDIYAGYSIPKGTHVMANVWNILHDVATYPDPMSFMPERFEDEETNKAHGINDLPLAAFGFGRRMCPGRYLALDTIWINIACVLSSFTISKAIDKNGRPVEPDIEFTSEFLSRPKPFQASIRPRSAAALELIRETEYDHPTS